MTTRFFRFLERVIGQKDTTTSEPRFRVICELRYQDVFKKDRLTSASYVALRNNHMLTLRIALGGNEST